MWGSGSRSQGGGPWEGLNELDMRPALRYTRLAVRQFDFALRLARVLSMDPSHTSLVFSPSSLAVLLAICADGARGATAKELLNLLSPGSSISDIRDYFHTIVQSLKRRSSDGAEVRSVSRVYISESWKVLPTFSNAARDTYDATLESVDFSQAAQLAQEVNAFVAATTKNRIQSIVSEEDFAETSAMLVNATYFEAKWLKPFDASNTHMRSFHKDVATSMLVPMMQTVGEFLYRSDDTYELLLLPYVGEQYSLLILLPRQHCSLRRMMQKIDGHSVLQSVERAAKRSLEVIIPKFKLEQKMDLRKALISMGVHSAFDPVNADFSGIAEGSHGLFVGKVVQKASIDVDEEGTVAAAATSVALRTCSADVPVYQKFVADHPFLYSVMDSDGNAFFTGTFAG